MVILERCEGSCCFYSGFNVSKRYGDDATRVKETLGSPTSQLLFCCIKLKCPRIVKHSKSIVDATDSELIGCDIEVPKGEVDELSMLASDLGIRVCRVINSSWVLVEKHCRGYTMN